MKCHFFNHNGEKYFIPGCWPAVLSGSTKDCSCPRHKKDRVQVLEEKILKMERRINELEQLTALLLGDIKEQGVNRIKRIQESLEVKNG